MADSKWKSIEIDQEVFEFLQRKARPVIDSANDVLRRLLLKDASQPRKRRSPRAKLELVSGGPLITSEMFVDSLLALRFGPGFEPVKGFSYLFERANDLVYFQNYNKSDPVLWYRIKRRPRALLREASGWLISTNPSERSAYVLRAVEVEDAARRAGWSRDYFEVHIDTRDHRWTELNWDLLRYRQTVK